MEPLQAPLAALPHIDPKEMHEKSIIPFKHWFRSENINKFDFLLHVRTLDVLQCNTQYNLQHRNNIFSVYSTLSSIYIAKITPT